MQKLKLIGINIPNQVNSFENLEYSTDFVQLDFLLKGKNEVEYGNTKIDSSTPPWLLILDKCVDLFSKTLDLRIAVALTRAALQKYGLEGLVQGLSIIRDLLSNRWDDVYPQLDKSDEFDPTQRLNVMLSLCEPDGLVLELLKYPIFHLIDENKYSELDHVNIRSIIAFNDIDPDTLDKRDSDKPVKLRLALINSSEDCIRKILMILQSCISVCKEIENSLNLKTTFSHNFQLDLLSKSLSQAYAIIFKIFPKFSLDIFDDNDNLTSTNNPHLLGNKKIDSITSRDDVYKMLEDIINYLTINEPNSPVPYLLKRSQKILNMNFHDLLEELSSDGLNQFKVVAGMKPSDNSHM